MSRVEPFTLGRLTGMGREVHGEYQWVAQQLVANGASVYAADLRGRGKSRWRTLLHRQAVGLGGDVSTVVRLAKSREPGVPVFMLGHSAGGVVCCIYTLDNQQELEGLICESFARAGLRARRVQRTQSHRAPCAHPAVEERRLLARSRGRTGEEQRSAAGARDSTRHARWAQSLRDVPPSHSGSWRKRVPRLLTFELERRADSALRAGSQVCLATRRSRWRASRFRVVRDGTALAWTDRLCSFARFRSRSRRGRAPPVPPRSNMRHPERRRQSSKVRRRPRCA